MPARLRTHEYRLHTAALLKCPLPFSPTNQLPGTYLVRYAYYFGNNFLRGTIILPQVYFLHNLIPSKAIMTLKRKGLLAVEGDLTDFNKEKGGENEVDYRNGRRQLALLLASRLT